MKRCVLRGGSYFTDDSRFLRTSFRRRSRLTPPHRRRSARIGFRLVVKRRKR